MRKDIETGSGRSSPAAGRKPLVDDSEVKASPIPSRTKTSVTAAPPAAKKSLGASGRTISTPLFGRFGKKSGAKCEQCEGALKEGALFCTK